jgi:hypothetical protein
MAYEAVNRPIGGFESQLANIGVNLVSDPDNPSDTTYEVTGDVTIAGALSVSAGAVTLSSNAGTLSKRAGKITSEALTTAAGAAVTFTITNTLVEATDIIILTRNGGTSDEGTPEWQAIPGSGSFTILLENRHASAAFDGTFIFGFLVIKQAT